MRFPKNSADFSFALPHQFSAIVRAAENNIEPAIILLFPKFLNCFKPIYELPAVIVEKKAISPSVFNVFLFCFA